MSPAIDRRFGTHFGFTFIELMLVIVLLGILATIVLASFGEPVRDAREIAVKSDLRTLRTQIVNYQVQHLTRLPPADRLVESLTMATDREGNSASATDSNRLGPYLDHIPVNPLNQLSTIKVIPASAELTPDDSTGWIYQAIDGGFKLIANTSKLDAKNQPIAEY